MFLGRRRHRLHGVGVLGPSLVNLIRVHHGAIATFPERLLEADTAAASSLPAAPLRNRHCLRVNGLFHEAPFVVGLLAVNAVRLTAGVGNLVGGVVGLAELVDRDLRRAEALCLAPSLDFVGGSNGN